MNRTETGRIVCAGLAIGLVAILLSAGAWAQDAAKPEQTPKPDKTPKAAAASGKTAKDPATAKKAAASDKAPQDGVTAAKILADAQAAYEALDTYKSEGTVVSDLEVNGSKSSEKTSFTILLKKPNLYLITWESGMDQAGAVWNEGTQPYFYTGLGTVPTGKSYSKIDSDELALGAAAGISGGAAFTVPSLILPFFKDIPPLSSRLTDAQREADAQEADVACYVVSGATDTSKKETYWISKSKHLIVKYSRSLEPPEKGLAMPELTDEQIEASIKASGQEVTDERKNKARAMMKSALENMKGANLKGTSVETQTSISTPPLTAKDFQHSAPEGAVLKDFPIGAGSNPGAAKPAAPAGGAAR